MEYIRGRRLYSKKELGVSPCPIEKNESRRRESESWFARNKLLLEGKHGGRRLKQENVKPSSLPISRGMPTAMSLLVASREDEQKSGPKKTEGLVRRPGKKGKKPQCAQF